MTNSNLNLGTIFDWRLPEPPPENTAGGMYNDNLMNHMRPEHDFRLSGQEFEVPEKPLTYSVYNPY